MRVCILFFEGQNKNKRMRDIVRSLGKGIEKQGHQVDIINAQDSEDKKLFFYEYICVGTVKNSFFTSKIPARINTVFSSAGSVSGKRSYAFVLKEGIRSQKALSLLMRQMEQQGMFLKRSDLVKTAVEAEYIGKKLHIAR